MKKTYATREEWVMQFNKTLPANGRGVEVGSFKGEFARKILNNWSGTLYLVDVWRPLSEEYDAHSNMKNFSDAYFETMQSIEGLEDRGIMIRAASVDAVKIFPDESLDFVYIDANHAYEFVKQDIAMWYPKVKMGGILAGHDYLDFDWYHDEYFAPNKKDRYIYQHMTDGSHTYAGVFGVNPAVNEFAEENNIDFNLTKEWYGTWYFRKNKSIK